MLTLTLRRNNRATYSEKNLAGILKSLGRPVLRIRAALVTRFAVISGRGKKNIRIARYRERTRLSSATRASVFIARARARAYIRAE